MNGKRRVGRLRTQTGPAAGRGRQHGFTLLEMGMVIALLGLLAYLVADFHVSQLNLRNAERRADGVVRDVREIIDASWAWAAADEDQRWPHDAADAIDIEQLRGSGLLASLPRNRYFKCPEGCQDYTLVGWDRDATTAGRFGAYRTSYRAPPTHADNPEDLVVRFTVPGSYAYTVAAQLPQGTAALVPPDPPDPDAPDIYRVEARVLRGGAGRYVLINNEGRPVVFGRTSAGGFGGLYNVATISSGTVGDNTALRLDLLSSGVSVQGGNLMVGGNCVQTGPCP